MSSAERGLKGIYVTSAKVAGLEPAFGDHCLSTVMCTQITACARGNCSVPRCYDWAQAR